MQISLGLTNRVGAKIPIIEANKVDIDFDVGKIKLINVLIDEAKSFGRSLWPGDKKKIFVGNTLMNKNNVDILIPISILTQFKIK